MNNNKWGLWILTTFVVGNMVGGGIFMLPANLAQVSSPLGSTIAWVATGLGVFMIALVFGNLAIRKPNLKAGPQSYAQNLFSSPKAGKVAGYSMAWGYWAANWAATASVIISFAGYLTTFFPIMQSKKVLFSLGSFELEYGKTITFIICSIMLWGIQWILSKSFNSAGKMNLMATITKVIGFALFIIFTLFIFDKANLGSAKEFVDASGKSFSLGGQVNAAAIATLWAFIGIESAVMLSNRAKSQRDVKTATILGLVISLVIYIGITLLTMGALSQEALRESQKPLVDALGEVIGSNGTYIMAVLALISLFGSTVGWIVVSSEVPYQAAKNGLFPAVFAKTNKTGSPKNSLTITNVMTQIFLFSTISGTVTQAYNFAIVVATLAYLIPYLVSAIYQMKLVITGETYDVVTGSRLKDGIITVLAFVYSIWVIKTGTADMKTFLLGIGLFVIGLILYPMIMRNSHPKEEEPVETETYA
ncbi:amino acid permease [Heyndrickxia oleronia]|jgi:arginine:ornithine antiporter/lysine permease|uniref:amino acid permease n=1 Tax=Heyndrickxia oleronia TaxID=38875 RepID=UPI0003A5C81B|nr:amino acid permease [Heyndrickxia oleronia]OJH18514.1 arginine:ornithine antiporter [Bacillus obstructivus]MCI1590788.1 amino acid permease [Heyndrickxia oleronia]MCI1612855.1 amino acid permease [Heyndrickxia oleronia]MCI1744081.1 amino acid permease [Heyndrickxia oleronia]MCI1761636.1 amino acid permease [Heyndrickxia oleronia]